MKTSDKIYIHRTIHLGLLSAAEIDITGQDEQYIRKDALMEWAKARKAELTSREPFVAGERKIIKEVIDKIESL